MKYILNFVAFLFVISTYGQTAMSRTIDIKDGQMQKFIQMAGKKTKQYKKAKKNGYRRSLRIGILSLEPNNYSNKKNN